MKIDLKAADVIAIEAVNPTPETVQVTLTLAFQGLVVSLELDAELMSWIKQTIVAGGGE